MAKVGEAILFIRANLTNLRKGLKEGTQLVNSFGKSVKGVGQSLIGLAGAAAQAGAALAAVFAPAVIQGARFEKTMSKVRALMIGSFRDIERAGGDTVEQQFTALNDKAKALGETTAFSASQVGEAMSFMALAGFNTQQVLDGVESTLALAAAGTLDLATASDIATDTMSAFQLKAADLSRVADVFAKTQASSNTSVLQMGEAMKFVAPIAATMGQSIEGVSAALGVLANTGIKGSSAGTGLARIMAQLAQKGDKVNKVLSKFGLTFEEINPEVVSLRDIVAKFSEANVGARESMELFGARGGRTMLALQGQGSEAFDTLQEKIENAGGSAEEMAKIQLANLAGGFTILKSQIEGLNIRIFEFMKESLEGLLQTVGRVIDTVQNWIDNNEALASVIGKVVVALGAILVAVVAIGGGLGILISTGGTLITVFGPVLGALKVLLPVLALLGGGFLSIAGTVIAIVIPAVLALMAAWDEISAALMSIWQTVIKPVFEGFAAVVMFAWTNVIKPVFGLLVNAIKQLFTTLERLFTALAPLAPLFKALAAAIAIVFIAPLVLGFTAFVVVIKIISSVISFLIDQFIELGRLTGLWGSEMETSAERTERFRKEVELFNKESEKLIKTSNSLIEANKDRIDSDAKALSLLEKQGDLNELQLKQLADLLEGEEDFADSLRDKVSLFDDEIARQEKRLAQGEKAGANTEALTESLRRLNSERKQAVTNLERFTAEENLLGDSLIRTAEQARASAVAFREQKEALTAADEARKGLTDSEEKIAALQESIRTRRLKGVDAELAKLESLRLKNRQLVDDRIADIKKLIDAEAVLAKSQIEEIEGPVNTKRAIELQEEISKRRLAIRQSESRQTGIIQAQEAFVGEQFVGKQHRLREDLTDERIKVGKIEKAITQLQMKLAAEQLAADVAGEEKRIAIEKRALDLKGELTEQGELLAAIEKDVADERLRIQRKSEKARADFIRDEEIAEAKRRGDTIRAAELQGEKLLATETAKIEELFKVREDMSDAEKEVLRKDKDFALQAAKEKSDALVTKAVGEQKDRKDVIVSAVEREANLEREVTGELGKQVKTVRDLFVLYAAIAKIRQIQEQRALVAADKGVRAQQKVARLEELLANADNDREKRRIQGLLDRGRVEARLLGSIASKRAGEAQLEGEAAQGQAAERQNLITQFTQMTQQIATLKVTITSELTAIGTLFSQAPAQWIEGFILAWNQNAPLMVETLVGTMRNLQTALTGGGVTPGTADVSGAVPAAPNPMPVGGIAPVGQVASLTDNRVLNAEIHNNVDAESVERRIGNIMGGTVAGGTRA